MLGVAPRTGTTRQRAATVLAQTGIERFKTHGDTEISFAAMPEVFDVAGFLYIATPDSGEKVAKIGLTTGSVRGRVSSLGTGFWAKIRPAAVVVVSGAALRTVEKIAHQVAASRGKRLNGEWFGLSADEALDAVIEACDRAGAIALSIEQAWWRGITDFMALQDVRPISDDARRKAMRLKLGMN